MRSASIFGPSMDGSTSDVGGSMTNTNVQSDVAHNNAKSQDAETEAQVSLIADRLLTSLNMVERAIIGNNFEKRLISFRNVPDAQLLEEKRLIEIQRALDRENEDGSLEDVHDGNIRFFLPMDSNCL